MPPTLRPRPVKTTVPKLPSKKRVSAKWCNFLGEMREMIIKKMEPDSRCRFARASKLCENEAKKSKNYIYGIGLDTTNRVLQLELSHNPESYLNYCLRFEKFGHNQTLVTYVSQVDNDSPEQLRWEEQVPGTPREVRWDYFKYYTDRYKHCFRKLYFTDSEYTEGEYNVKHLKNLSYIESLTKNIIQKGFLSLDQVNKAKFAHFADTDFTFEEVMRFNGCSLTIKSDEFDEEAVGKYLKMRKRGEIHENMRHLRIWVGRKDNRNFDVIKEGLGAFNYEENGNECRFQFKAKHHLSDNCYIDVEYLDYVATFVTNLGCK